MCLTTDYISTPIYNVNNIFFKYKLIPDGEYNNDKIKVKISTPNKDYKRIEIESDDYSFLIRFLEYGYDVVYQNKKDLHMKNNNYSLNIAQALGSINEFVKIKSGDKNYTIFENLIRVNNEEYKIKDSIIKKIINNHCFIEYDYKKNKVYTCISIKTTPTSKEDYTKFKLDLESLVKNLQTIKNYLEKNNWKEYIKFLPFNKLKNLNINELNTLKQELIEIADIYTTYKSRLNIENKHLEEISLFADYLIKNAIDARINKLSNHILNSNMEDINELKFAINELKTILKEKKKEKKLKKEMK